MVFIPWINYYSKIDNLQSVGMLLTLNGESHESGKGKKGWVWGQLVINLILIFLALDYGLYGGTHTLFLFHVCY